MMYLTVHIYRLLVIIFISGSSVISGGSETGMTNEKSIEIGGRIVNGTKVKFGRFKYIVAVTIIQRKLGLCGGSIIADSWVVTAAHCVATLSQSDTVRVAGGVLRLYGATRQERTVKKWIVHPNYDRKRIHKDIALLMVDKPFNWNEYVQPVSCSLTSPAAGTICTVAGWGTTQPKRSSKDLLSIDIPIIDYGKCRKLFMNDFEKGEICAGYDEGGIGSCTGDSGGPLECNGVLTGVVSGGHGCARPLNPTRYTDVSFFKDWINEYIVSDVITSDIGPISTDSVPIPTDSSPITTDSTSIPTDKTVTTNHSKSIMPLVPLIYIFSSSFFIFVIENIFLWQN